MHVMVVEDDPSQQRLLTHLLSRWDYSVVVATTGAEAIRMLADESIAIALVDWNLPDMTGLDVCQAIREHGAFVHVIVLSARDADADVPVAIEAGASDYLGKPFVQSELRARLLVGNRMVNLHRRVSQMQKLESIGQLAAGVAHEINTPAQFVSDNLQFACDAIADLSEVVAAQRRLIEQIGEDDRLGSEAIKVCELAEQKEADYLLEELPACLSQSLDGIRRVAAIVRAMKSFSHPGVTRSATVDINDALESTTTVARHEWRHVATLELDLDPSLPLISGLPGELNQVFLNILVNAAHAIDEAHGQDPQRGRIEISTRVDGDCVRIAIADNGPGIPDEIASKVFDPFFTTKGVGRGTGQGLALAYDVVVRKHGGRIQLHTEVGRGTTFEILLPLRAPSETDTAG